MEAAKKKSEKQYEELKSEGISSSRNVMLKAIQQNQPSFISLPPVPVFTIFFDDVLQKYIDVLTGIGGHAYVVNSYDEIIRHMEEDFKNEKKIISCENIFSGIAALPDVSIDPHEFGDVDVCILSSELAVAENGAIWISDKEMPVRVLPFIAQSLVAVVHRNNIVPTMHDAYNVIADRDYDFATFIAGPSKTADIEQSLVLGAHGPKAMTVFIITY